MENNKDIREQIVDTLIGKKVVINTCYGGFGISDKAFELYLTKKGIQFYKGVDSKSQIIPRYYYKVPEEEYCRLQVEYFKKYGNYKEFNAKGLFLSSNDIERDDPILIEVINELGEEANGNFSKLKIVEIPGNIDWEINEYDGKEQIHEKHRNWG